MSSEKDTEKIKLRREGELWTCQIDGKEYNFQRWTWGQKNRAVGRCTRLSPNGMQYLDTTEFNLDMLLATLKKAPFDIKRDVIENYPDPRHIDKLLQITTKLNILGEIEVQNL